MERYLSEFLKKLSENIVIDLHYCSEFLDPFKYERISSNDYEKFIEDDYIIIYKFENEDGSYELEVCK